MWDGGVFFGKVSTWGLLTLSRGSAAAIWCFRSEGEGDSPDLRRDVADKMEPEMKEGWGGQAVRQSSLRRPDKKMVELEEKVVGFCEKVEDFRPKVLHFLHLPPHAPPLGGQQCDRH